MQRRSTIIARTLCTEQGCGRPGWRCLKLYPELAQDGSPESFWISAGDALQQGEVSLWMPRLSLLPLQRTLHAIPGYKGATCLEDDEVRCSAGLHDWKGNAMLAWKLSMKAARLVSLMPSGAGHQTGIGPCAIMTQIAGNAHKCHASLIHDMRHAPCMDSVLCSAMELTANRF